MCWTELRKQKNMPGISDDVGINTTYTKVGGTDIVYLLDGFVLANNSYRVTLR